jgi:hypothetical protein
MKVGGGYWQVLLQLCRQTFFGTRRLPRQSELKQSELKQSKTGGPKPKQ